MNDYLFDQWVRAPRVGRSRRGFIAALAAGVLAQHAITDAGAGYSDTCTKFRLAGGRDRTDRIVVDDRLVVSLNGNVILTIGEAGSRAPFDFFAKKGDRLKIAAYDIHPPGYELSKLVLHCIAGGTGRRRLTKKMGDEKKNWRRPKLFLNEGFIL